MEGPVFQCVGESAYFGNSLEPQSTSACDCQNAKTLAKELSGFLIMFIHNGRLNQ